MNTLQPVLLRPDNFTSTTRTPWGGTRILGKYKLSAMTRSDNLDPHVGESWEISVEPDFPSRCARTGALLADRIAEDLAGWLGEEGTDGRVSTALLVKLLDAQDDLSVQIHPADEYAGLSEGESGKPESWYILDADHGAGLYLGLRPGVQREEVARALASNADVSNLMYFTEVSSGDFFVIDAGTPHAIGAGVTLVEPQRVVPGKRGVTYRFWDWNRRYNETGQVDPNGKMRPLHVEDALAVTDWRGPRGDELLEKIRFRAGGSDTRGTPRFRRLCGPLEAPIEFLSLSAGVVDGTGPLKLPAEGRLLGITVVAGVVRIGALGADETVVTCGYSAVIPAASGALTLTLEGAHAVICGAY